MAMFEGACAFIIALTLYAMARHRPLVELLRDYLALALSAWLGEQSCIQLYKFYSYSPAWHGRLGQVPILVPLIWPLVVLSACEVARQLRPRLSIRALAGLVAAIVALDASLVEVVAVRAGLWQWVEPGHLGVPLIGVLGWAYFALGAAFCLLRPAAGWRLLLIPLAPLCAHVLILASWWGLFRWTLRGELGTGSVVGILAVGALALGAAAVERRRGGGIPLLTALPRALAASLFLMLLLTSAPADGKLWLHTAAVAVPYCVATRWHPAWTRSPPV